MAELIGQAQSDPALAATLRIPLARTASRGASTAVLLRACDRGEIRADIDIPVVLDQLYAPLYYRLTMQHEPLTADLADVFVDTVLEGIRARSRGADRRAVPVRSAGGAARGRPARRGSRT